jgi:hypothetical protein
VFFFHNFPKMVRVNVLELGSSSNRVSAIFGKGMNLAGGKNYQFATVALKISIRI